MLAEALAFVLLGIEEAATLDWSVAASALALEYLPLQTDVRG